MHNRILTAVIGLSALVFFEGYIYYKMELTGTNLPKCFPTGEIYPFKDANGNIRYDSVYHTISKFTLTDQYGKAFTSDFLKNKIYVANFFFSTCLGICPKMTDKMHWIQEEFKGEDRLQFVSHTVDPEHDSGSVLKAYAIQNKIDGKRWHLLTGSRIDLFTLSKKSYFLTSANDASGIFAHSEKFVLVDQQRIIRGYYDGTDSKEVNRLKKDIEKLLSEL